MPQDFYIVEEPSELSKQGLKNAEEGLAILQKFNSTNIPWATDFLKRMQPIVRYYIKTFTVPKRGKLLRRISKIGNFASMEFKF